MFCSYILCIYIQWVRKVFRPPYIFSLFVILQPFAKIICSFFFSHYVHTAPHIDRKTQNCWHFCRFIKKENLKYHMVLSIQTLCSVFSRSTLWFNTARSLFGKDATSFSHLDLGILCHSSLQILSSSVRLDGKQPFLGLSRDAQLGLSQGSGWAIQEQSRSCCEAIPSLF